MFTHGFWSVTDKGDTAQLMRNTFAWAGGPNKKTKRIGIRGRGAAPLRKLFGEAAVSLDGRGWTEKLGEIDVLFVGVWGLKADEAAVVDTFVRTGGGLVSGGPGWGWQQLNPTK